MVTLSGEKHFKPHPQNMILAPPGGSFQIFHQVSVLYGNRPHLTPKAVIQ